MPSQCVRAEEESTSSDCWCDRLFLFVNSQLMKSKMIDFGFNMGCEMHSVSLRRSSLSCYLREFRAGYFTVAFRAYKKRMF